MNSEIAHRHTLGINRRELLQDGYSGLIGCGLPTLLAQQARAAESAPSREQRARSVILISERRAYRHSASTREASSKTA